MNFVTFRILLNETILHIQKKDVRLIYSFYFHLLREIHHKIFSFCNLPGSTVTFILDNLEKWKKVSFNLKLLTSKLWVFWCIEENILHYSELKGLLLKSSHFLFPWRYSCVSPFISTHIHTRTHTHTSFQFHVSSISNFLICFPIY